VAQETLTFEHSVEITDSAGNVVATDSMTQTLNIDTVEEIQISGN